MVSFYTWRIRSLHINNIGFNTVYVCCFLSYTHDLPIITTKSWPACFVYRLHGTALMATEVTLAAIRHRTHHWCTCSCNFATGMVLNFTFFANWHCVLWWWTGYIYKYFLFYGSLWIYCRAQLNNPATGLTNLGSHFMLFAVYTYHG